MNNLILLMKLFLEYYKSTTIVYVKIYNKTNIKRKTFRLILLSNLIVNTIVYRNHGISHYLSTF